MTWNHLERRVRIFAGKSKESTKPLSTEMLETINVGNLSNGEQLAYMKCKKIFSHLNKWVLGDRGSSQRFHRLKHRVRSSSVN